MIEEVTNKKENVPVKGFPKLMIDTHLNTGVTIVLFTSLTTGILLKNNNGIAIIQVGDICADFDISCFEDYNEPFTIKNV